MEQRNKTVKRKFIYHISHTISIYVIYISKFNFVITLPEHLYKEKKETKDLEEDGRKTCGGNVMTRWYQKIQVEVEVISKDIFKR